MVRDQELCLAATNITPLLGSNVEPVSEMADPNGELEFLRCRLIVDSTLGSNGVLNKE